MSKRISLGAGAVIVVWSIVAGCGGGSVSGGYGADGRAEFVDDCTTSGTSAATCRCFYDTMAARLPYARFEAVNEKMQAGSTRIPGDVAGMAAGCAARLRAR